MNTPVTANLHIMKHALLSSVAIVTLALAGCAVGPNYKRPTTETPAHYKAEALGSWKEGQPGDHVPKGDWWNIFGDETLNDLQSRATGANQELKAAVARVQQARATARVARSELLPTLNADSSYTRQRFSPNQVPSFGDLTANNYRGALDLSYEIDLWSRVRRGFESARADAQASLAKRRAELENALAILVGENPSTFKFATASGDGGTRWNPAPPKIPADLPSDLLERRADVSEAERQLAAANARIGVAKAAFFPVLRLTGSGGYVSGDIESLFNWDSRVWSIGPSLPCRILAAGGISRT